MQQLLDLVKRTLTRPAEAAEAIMALRKGVSNETLWSAVVLAAVLNALIISAGLVIFPPPPEQAEMMPQFFFRPGLLAIFTTGAIVITIFMLHWAGQMLGGQGDLRDMLACFTWLELLQAGAQALVLLLATVATPLADMLNFVAFFWGIWILIAFVDRVHGFGNPLKAVSVLALGLGLLVAGVIILVLLIATFSGGVSAHV